MRQLKVVFLLLICMGIISFLPNLVWAAVTGPCIVCHIMHNSQNGETVDGGGPYRHLTKGDCIGCHTGDNVAGAGTSTGATPFVYSADEPDYGTDTLAGGHFWWVADDGGNDDAKGHNVWNLSEQDGNITAGEGAPGGSVGCGITACHATLAIKQEVIPALGSGCEGCHTHVAHHKSGDTTPIVDEEDGWFRFCSSAHDGGVRGATGLEDDDWQYVTGPANHNEYLGIVGDHGVAGGFAIGNTMTAYCCGCHGNFHIQDDSGLWVRHPSDAYLPGGDTEYAAYTVYSPQAPVARLLAFDWSSGPSGTVLPNDATDMVMCLSCHRAHGSPYDDMLRWDYDTQLAGGGGGGADNTGCFTCHTAKDD